MAGEPTEIHAPRTLYPHSCMPTYIRMCIWVNVHLQVAAELEALTQKHSVVTSYHHREWGNIGVQSTVASESRKAWGTSQVQSQANAATHPLLQHFFYLWGAYAYMGSQISGCLPLKDYAWPADS